MFPGQKTQKIKNSTFGSEQHQRQAKAVGNEHFGRETLFTEEEELGLVKFTAVMARLGYGVSNAALQKYADEMAYKVGKRTVDKPVSIWWLYWFLQRWRTRVVSKKPSALDSNRARNSTQESI